MSGSSFKVEFVDLVADLIEQKPETAADASVLLRIFHSRVSAWLVLQLPAVERELWHAATVIEEDIAWCCSRWHK